MKIEKYILSFIIGLFILSSPFLAAQSATNFSKKALMKQSLKFPNSDKKIDSHIKEVYGNNSELLVFNNSTRYKAIKSIYSRLFLLERPAQKDEKYIKLSSVDLNDKYDSNLIRNRVFNSKQFNPLLYKLDFFPKQSITYRVDNTNLILIILPEY